MSKRMKLVAAVSVLAAPGLLVLTAGPSQSATTVPTCPATSLTKTAGTQSGYINQTNNNQTWNLTGAVWNSTPTSSHYYPVRSDAFTKGCIIGGSVDGRVPQTATRDQWYNGEDGGTRLGGEGFRQTLTTTAGNWAKPPHAACAARRPSKAHPSTSPCSARSCRPLPHRRRSCRAWRVY